MQREEHRSKIPRSFRRSRIPFNESVPASPAAETVEGWPRPPALRLLFSNSKKAVANGHANVFSDRRAALRRITARSATIALSGWGAQPVQIRMGAVRCIAVDRWMKRGSIARAERHQRRRRRQQSLSVEKPFRGSIAVIGPSIGLAGAKRERRPGGHHYCAIG